MKSALFNVSRTWLVAFALLAVLGTAAVGAWLWAKKDQQVVSADTIVVYKRASCDCCRKWVVHLEQAGFKVAVHDEATLSAQQDAHGVPSTLRACHTAKVGGYFIEGHVPAQDIRRLLAEKPQALGLAVPGMPVGSPGMEMGDRRDPYATLLVQSGGKPMIFARHGAKE